MNGNELVQLFRQSGKRFHLTGSVENGIVVGLDLEGRLFAVRNNQVLNKVNTDAILGVTTRTSYLNPGGDGLWPAPEGTCFGYEYATGKWRVPPGLTGARFVLVEHSEDRSVIEAEVDLVNASGLGVPTIFRRDITVRFDRTFLVTNIVESITYIGNRNLKKSECLLAPWTLCQFDSDAGCEVLFPDPHNRAAWDLYESSSSKRFIQDGLHHARTDGGFRYQIGIDDSVEWIEYRNPSRKLKVRRSAGKIPADQSAIDIIDAPPDQLPSAKQTRFSIYNDPSFFMEIEAVGGSPDILEPGTVMSVEVVTEYQLGMED